MGLINFDKILNNLTAEDLEGIFYTLRFYAEYATTSKPIYFNHRSSVNAVKQIQKTFDPEFKPRDELTRFKEACDRLVQRCKDDPEYAKKILKDAQGTYDEEEN
jgi:hypothetical protein